MESKVSICIPTYNGELYIKEAIDSVLSQSYYNCEILVVDDCSTDSTVDLIEEYHDNRIKLIRNDTNIGMVNNWNKCLKESKGEYVQFLFQDDILFKDCIIKKLNAFNNDNRVNMVFGASKIIDSNGVVLSGRRYSKHDHLINGCEIAYKSFLFKNYFGEPSNVMFKKDITKNIGYFNNNMSYIVDQDYWIRMSAQGYVYYLSDYLMKFRISRTAMTSKLINRMASIFNEDNLFLESVKKNERFRVTKKDEFVHKIFMYLRTMLKYVYISIFI
jgi:glycosyltransferase involved in cell wall biosynthesis